MPHYWLNVSSRVWQHQTLKNYGRNFDETSLPNIVFLLLKLASAILFRRQTTVMEISALFAAVKKCLPPNEIRAEENIQLHFIFGLPMNELAEDLIRFLSSMYGLPSDCYFTILQGTRKNVQSPNLKINKNKLTIGDDVELASQELYQSNKLFKLYNMKNCQSQSSSLYQNHDDSYVELKCIRKFQRHQYIVDTAYNKFRKLSHFHKFVQLFCLFAIFVLQNSTNKDSKIIGKMIDCFSAIIVLDLVWICYYFLSEIFLQLYFLILIFDIYSSDNSLIKKQTLKRFLTLTSSYVLTLFFGVCVAILLMKFMKQEMLAVLHFVYNLLNIELPEHLRIDLKMSSLQGNNSEFCPKDANLKMAWEDVPIN